MTNEEKVKIYEEFIERIAIAVLVHDYGEIEKLSNKAHIWSYAYRVGNGELSPKEQKEEVNRATRGLIT